MIDYNIEFTKGVLFVRLFGVLNKFNEKDIECDILEIIKDAGIKNLVYNLEDLELQEDVSLFKDSEEIIKNNLGKMLICSSNQDYINDFEYVDDELSAIKVLETC